MADRRFGELSGPFVDPARGGKASSLIIMLHGWGADGNDLADLAYPFSLRFPGAAFFVPNAPEPCSMNPAGRQWFDIEDRVTGPVIAAPVIETAIAAAAKGNMYLVVFGLLLSVPIIIAGSAIILKLMSRYPVIISMGAGLLGWLAGDLIVHDPLLESYLNFQIPYANLLITGGFAAVVVVVGRTLAMRQKTV